MRVIGIATTAVVAAGALFAVVILIMSIPDIKRYLEIRKM